MDDKIKISDVIFSAIGSKPSELIRISGNSLAKNYLCVCENYEELFIKIYHAENSTFPMQQLLYENGIPVPKPINEVCIGQNSFCAVYEYVTSLPMSLFLEQCPNKELTCDIAANLNKMHKLKLNNLKKVEDTHLEIKKLVAYINLNSINFGHKSEMIDYLLSNSVDVPEERLGMVHMDFHLKNILISRDDKRILFTDFENLEYGDTWRDFVYAVLFHEPREHFFWYSFILYYFNNSIPDLFWEITKYYCYIQALRMIVCEHKKGNDREINRLAESINIGFPLLSPCPQWIAFMNS